jgi:hypothetical protein
MATLAWVCLMLSAYLSHSWSSAMENNHSILKARLPRFSGPMAVLFRLAGKSLAVFNTWYLVIHNILQFTRLFNNCWCESVVLQWGVERGFVSLFLGTPGVAAVSAMAWKTGVFLAISISFICTLFIFFSTGDELFQNDEA